MCRARPSEGEVGQRDISVKAANYGRVLFFNNSPANK